MREIVIEVLKNYAYLIAWAIILFVSLFDKLSNKKLYKYEQRVEPTLNTKTDVDVKKLIEKNRIIKIRKFDLGVLIVLIISILGSVASTVTMFLNITTIKTTIFFILLYAITSMISLLGDIKYSKKVLKTIYFIIGVIIAFPTYYFISINQPFFWDLIIIFLTIVCYFIFYKTKFKYVALLLLLGLNILIVGQKVDITELKILNEICFAVGTGLIATGIGNILIICENNKRIKIERLKELDDINLYIENVVENLFYDTSKSLKITISDFEFINYDEFVRTFENFLKRKNSNIIKILGQHSKESLEELSNFSK